MFPSKVVSDTVTPSLPIIEIPAQSLTLARFEANVEFPIVPAELSIVTAPPVLTTFEMKSTSLIKKLVESLT